MHRQEPKGGNIMTLWSLIKRNTKIYFKDKSVFLSSLITPLILLFLFITFLKNVYLDSIKSQLPEGITLSQPILNGFVGSWLISSILATSCITIAFCANMIMVQDKVTGCYKDLTITPVKKSTLNLSYYLSTAIVTAIVCYSTFGIGLIYLTFTGFYLSFIDIFLVIFDIALLVLFGTALSSIVCMFLKSQGAISAVATLVSSMYGFICGAYMPLSQFSVGLRNVLMFLPGTYGTGLIRNHMMRGVLNEIKSQGLPTAVISKLSSSFDATLSFFGKDVNVWSMYLVLGLSTCVLVSAFILIDFINKKHKKSKTNNGKSHCRTNG